MFLSFTLRGSFSKNNLGGIPVELESFVRLRQEPAGKQILSDRVDPQMIRFFRAMSGVKSGV